MTASTMAPGLPNPSDTLGLDDEYDVTGSGDGSGSGSSSGGELVPRHDAYVCDPSSSNYPFSCPILHYDGIFDDMGSHGLLPTPEPDTSKPVNPYAIAALSAGIGALLVGAVFAMANGGGGGRQPRGPRLDGTDGLVSLTTLPEPASTGSVDSNPGGSGGSGVATPATPQQPLFGDLTVNEEEVRGVCVCCWRVRSCVLRLACGGGELVRQSGTTVLARLSFPWCR